jgi:hypothetical protein
MAKAKITHQWADGSATVMQVSTAANGPDSLDECVSRVTNLWRECVGDGVEVEAEDTP